MKLPLGIIFLALCLFGCGVQKNQSEESSLKYDTLNHYYGLFKGLYAGVKICVTGPLANKYKHTVGDSYFKWIREIQKVDRDVLASISYNCTDPNYYVETHDTDGRAHATRGGLIRLYKNSDGATVTHELGHMFVGLADTYVEGVWTCKPGQPLSIMCSTQKVGNRLLQDDIIGLRHQFSNYASLDRPDAVARHISRDFPGLHKCPQMRSHLGKFTTQLSYREGRVSKAYIHYKFSDEVSHTIEFPYLQSKRVVLQRHADVLWQKLLDFDPSLDACLI